MLITKSFFRHNKTCLFYGFVFVFLIMGIQSFALGQVSHSVEFNRSKISFTSLTAEDGNTYDKLLLADLSQTDEFGKPLLPVKYVKLIIPSNQDVDRVIFTNIEKREFEGEYMILPAQPGIPTSVDFQKSAFVPPDSSVYNSDQPYPAEAVKVIRDGYFDGSNHIVTVAVYPLQYKPKSGQLLFYSFIDFELTLKPGGILRAPGGMRSRKNQKVYDAILERIVDNPWDIPLYRTRPSLGKVMKIQTNPLPSYEYVIITNNTLKSEFDAFVSWKKRKGWDIGVVTMDSITTYYSSDDTSGITDDAGALRQYLADSFNDGSPKTMWALLAGDHTIAPVRYGAGYNNCSWEDYSFYKIPADLYFADFNGDWHVDTETPTRYGEPSHDDPEYEPEIYVGRIPVTSAQEVEIWVDKLLQYELKPGNGIDSYLCKAFWTSADQMINQPDYVDDYYPSSFTGNHTKYKEDHPGDEVVEEMSNKYGLLNWYCHGNVNSFDAYDPTPSARFVWTTDDGEYWDMSDNLVQSGTSGDGLDNMTNDNYPSVVYSICCDVCGFDDFRSTDNPGSLPNDGNCYPTDQRSMAEGFTCMNWYVNGPIILGNARWGWVYYSYLLHEEFCDLWDTADFHNSGIAELISKLNYSGSYDHYLSYSHNCYGCPETEIWTDSLDSFTNVAISDNGNSITINANVSGCNICACSGNNGEDFWQVESDVSNYTFNTSERPLYITITKHNYAPYTAVTGGTFTSDEIWFGNLLVLGDVTIDSNKTLEILPGTIVSFKANSDDQSGGYDTGKAELIIEGTLKADNATFKSTTTGDNTWYGIVFDEATSTSYLKNCTIQRARRGVRAQDCSPTIESCDLDHNQYGLWAVGSSASPTFKKNDINYGCYAVAVQNNATPDVEDNKLRNLEACIYIHNGGDPDCINNTLYGYNNGKYQVLITSSASGGDFGGWNGKGNYLTDDVRYDLVEVDGGMTSFGYDVFENPSSVNEIYIDNNTGNTVNAEYCYWDNGGEPSSDYFDGAVDRWPYLDTEPESGVTWKIMNPISPFDDGLADYKNKEFSRAAQELRTAFENNSDHHQASWALAKLARAVRIAQEEDAYKQFFDDILSNSDNVEHQQVARSFHLNFYADRAQLSLAEKYALMAPESSLFDRELLLDMVYRYALAQDEESEQRIISLLKKRYPDDKDLEESIKWAKLPVEDDLAYLAYKGGKGMLKESPVVTAKKFALLTAYPNPFNASTTIAFNLPKRSHVQLNIFDINGRLVRTLIDESMNVGQHKVIWNGNDDKGCPVASGLYLGQVVTNESRQTIKMILAK